LNSVQFVFNEKGTSLESFKKYVDAQNYTILKIATCYEKSLADYENPEDL
jgi:hypothetical protein